MTDNEDEAMNLSKKLLKTAIGAEIKAVELRYKDGGPITLSADNPNLQKIGSVKLLFPKPENMENNNL